MPCLLFRPSSSSSTSLLENGTTLSRVPSVLDLPFLSPPKHVRFPCPFASPELFASTHSTYSQAEYDRTPIEPPSEEERSCALPGRGERCFDSDGAERDCQEEETDEGTEGVDRDDGGEVFEEEEDGTDADEVEHRESGGQGLFRCWTVGVEEDDAEEEVNEGETSDDHREASPTLLLRHLASSSSSKRHPPTPGPTRRPSSTCSPTTARRLQWLQTQTESLPTALRDRLLLLASSSSTSPPPSPSILGSPSSPTSMASLSGSPPSSNFSFFSFAARSPPDSEAEDGGDDDAEERTIHSSTPRPNSSFPVSMLNGARPSFQSSAVSDDLESLPTSSSIPVSLLTTSTPPRFHRPHHSFQREDSECSSTGSRTTDEPEGFFNSPACSSASSASDWGIDEGSSTADTSFVASEDGGAAAEWEGLGKELGEVAGGFRVSRWALGGQQRSADSS